MPASGTGIPRQTLRRARAAYRKSVQTPTLSEAEVRHVQRAAELEARAERLREAERRKKHNREQRAKKDLKEKEARKRMGIPKGPISAKMEEGQEVLGRFREKPTDDEPVDSGLGPDIEASRAPLVEHSANATSRTAQRELSQVALLSQHHLLPPTPQAQSESLENQDWDAFFPTNTQVERDITCESRQALVAQASSRPTGPEPRARADDADSSTQDLDITSTDLAEIEAAMSTRYPGHDSGDSARSRRPFSTHPASKHGTSLAAPAAKPTRGLETMSESLAGPPIEPREPWDGSSFSYDSELLQLQEQVSAQFRAARGGVTHR
ncbi:MAG: hypothetical protein M1832_004974 [Thelocarpon impressellum]|nr:MAG: hypothetical protein M1832_004974 [Thelocarpon impressellum]